MTIKMITKRNLLCLTVLCLLCTGCNHAPSIDIIGSFFPVWMLCLTLGIILTFVVRYLLVRKQLETEVGNLALFYPCVVVLFTCLLWLIFFR
jgi:YtcA family